MISDAAVDQHLIAVREEVLIALYQAKQLAWAESASARHAELEELVHFLVVQTEWLTVAEERIGGRSPLVSSPSVHQHGNVIAEANGDHRAAAISVASRLEAVVADVRERAAAMVGAPEADRLTALADGLANCSAVLRAGAGAE